MKDENYVMYFSTVRLLYRYERHTVVDKKFGTPEKNVSRMSKNIFDISIQLKNRWNQWLLQKFWFLKYLIKSNQEFYEKPGQKNWDSSVFSRFSPLFENRNFNFLHECKYQWILHLFKFRISLFTSWIKFKKIIN